MVAAVASDDPQMALKPPQATEKGVGGGVEFFGQARSRHEVAHQHKQRYDGQLIVDGGIKSGLTDIGQCATPADDVGHANGAGEHHRKRHRQA